MKGTLFDPTLIGINTEAKQTVASLPTVAPLGADSFVTDANSTTFGAAAVGGGANKVPVYWDGVSWKIG